MDRRAFVRALPAVAGLAGGLGTTTPFRHAAGHGIHAPGAVAPAAGDPPADRSGRVASAAPASRIDAIGVQLYTVRQAMAQDIDGTLAALSEIGYREVEVAGLYGLRAAELRLRLNDAGLRAVSGHVSLAVVRTRWSEALDEARLLGQDWVVVPSLPGEERDAESLRRIADELSWAGEVARSSGLRFGYHNHDWELRQLPERVRPIDLLLERTQADLVDWQMDVFWTVHGGGDPAEYLRRMGERVTTLHIKDRTADGRMVDVGDGVIDFASLIRAASERSLAHVFVEHDRPGDPLESTRRSFAHLTSVVDVSPPDGRGSSPGSGDPASPSLGRGAPSAFADRVVRPPGEPGVTCGDHTPPGVSA